MSARLSNGLKAWVWQRVSAVYIAGFSVYFALYILLSDDMSYVVWRAWFTQMSVAVGFYLYILSLLLHAWIGLRDIVMDYVHHYGLRFFALAILALGLMACAVWASFLLVL